MEIFKNLIVNLGNPEFIKLSTTTNEQKFLFHIMNFSRNLDLMRCYPPSQYKAVIGLENKLAIKESNEQKKALHKLFKFANDSIEATGDRRFTKFEEGRLKSHRVQEEGDYNDEFFRYSRDPAACNNLCADLLYERYPASVAKYVNESKHFISANTSNDPNIDDTNASNDPNNSITSLQRQ